MVCLQTIVFSGVRVELSLEAHIGGLARSFGRDADVEHQGLSIRDRRFPDILNRDDIAGLFYLAHRNALELPG